MMVGRLAAGGIVRQLVTSQMRQSGNSWGGVSQSAKHFPALGPTSETLPSSEDHKFTTGACGDIAPSVTVGLGVTVLLRAEEPGAGSALGSCDLATAWH